jgi:hypothetical protein
MAILGLAELRPQEGRCPTAKFHPRKIRCKLTGFLRAIPPYLMQPGREVRRSKRTQKTWRLEEMERACMVPPPRGKRHSRPENHRRWLSRFSSSKNRHVAQNGPNMQMPGPFRGLVGTRRLSTDNVKLVRPAHEQIIQFAIKNGPTS